MNNTILVTGGAGYIGSHACKALACAGYTPVAFDNMVYGNRWAVRWGPFVEGDLSDKVLLQQTLKRYGIKAVMHFAAYAYVGESVTDPAKYFTNNVSNTLNLLNCMLEADIRRIVFSSTCATYGIPNQVPITEDHEQKPINPYGESKMMIERILKWYEPAYDMHACMLRYFNAAGADPEGEIGECHVPETHLIPLVLDAASGKRPAIDIYGTDYPTPDGTAVRDYIHVTDLAKAHVIAMERLFSDGGTTELNLGTGKGYSVREVISTAEKITGRSVPYRETPRRAGDPPVLVADASKAFDILGWKPEFSDLETIIGTAWNWHNKHQTGI